jgi:hypothetical protein
VFPHPSFYENPPSENQWCPKYKVRINVLNFRDQVKICYLLEDGKSLAEVGQRL